MNEPPAEVFDSILMSLANIWSGQTRKIQVVLKAPHFCNHPEGNLPLPPPPGRKVSQRWLKKWKAYLSTIQKKQQDEVWGRIFLHGNYSKENKNIYDIWYMYYIYDIYIYEILISRVPKMGVCLQKTHGATTKKTLMRWLAISTSCSFTKVKVEYVIWVILFFNLALDSELKNGIPCSWNATK